MMNININGNTKLLALLGHPVEHSISPAMHSAAAGLLDLPYVYLAFDITPEKLPEAIDSLRLFGARGFNLTMPLKRDVIPLLDRISDAARLCNSVNTVTIEEDGSLNGDTTDGRGLIRSLSESGVYKKEAAFTILGAGGAARSIAAALALDGVSDLVLCKRKNATFDEAREYVKMLSSECVIKGDICDMSDPDAFSSRMAKTDILINATNVGMGADDRSPVEKELLRRDMFVCDIIYDPQETRLLKDAASIGAGTANGLGMLLYQGAESFRIWTGEEMPILEIKKTIFQ